MPKEFDLAICTATYFGPYGNCTGAERKEYFAQMLESARHVDWPQDKKIVWVVSDDASPIHPPPIPSGIGIPIYMTLQPKNLGNQMNLLWVTNEGTKLADLVAYCDNDGEFSKDCFHRLFALIDKYPWCTGYALFNTPYHGIVEAPWIHDRLRAHGVEQTDFDDHCLKQTNCEHGTVFRSSTWEWDGSWAAGLHAVACLEPPFPCLKPSGMQHIGKLGLNGTNDDYDKDFVRGW